MVVAAVEVAAAAPAAAAVAAKDCPSDTRLAGQVAARPHGPVEVAVAPTGCSAWVAAEYQV